MQKFSQTSSNQFFKNNSIQPIQRTTSYSSTDNVPKRKQHSQTKSAVKINPTKFVHRQVFNTKLYQASSSTNLNSNEKPQSNMKKFFQISLTKQDRLDAQLGDEEDRFLIQSNKHLSQHKYYSNKQVQKSWKHLFHHFRVLQKLIRVVDPKDPFKATIKNINEHFELFLDNLFHEYDKMAHKVKQFNLNINSLSRDPYARPQFAKNTQKQMNQIYNISTLTKFDSESLIKNHKQRINILQFENKKMMLLCQKLQQDLKLKAKQFDQKQIQCNKLYTKFQQIEKQRQGYQFKIKKLKQQLEVAHIVKQQNLADKVNYILGWNL